MTVYAIAQLSFVDEPAYRRYQAAAPAVFAQFNMKVLVADEAPLVSEGEWSGDKVVILEFPDAEEATRFSTSPEYQAIARDRKAGATGPILMVRGVE